MSHEPPMTRPKPSLRASSHRRILFLDDDPARAEIFLERFPEACWVRTVSECLRALAEPWDIVHLDHDLEGEKYVPSERADCGMEVVRWLRAEQRSHLGDACFIVHTHNTAAGAFMLQALSEAGYHAEYRPFGCEPLEWIDLKTMFPIVQHSSTPPAPIRLWSSFCQRLGGLWRSISLWPPVDTATELESRSRCAASESAVPNRSHPGSRRDPGG